MPIQKRDLRQCLTGKFGFEEVEGSRHEAVTLFIEGRKIATARFSRSHSDVGDEILGLIAKEIRVQLNFLKRMYGCTKSRDDYLNHLRDTGYLP